MGQLTEYILKYKQTYSKEQISQALLKKGCTTEQFEKAWSEAEKTPTQEVTAPAEIQSEQNQEVTASRQVQKTPTQEGGRRASKLIIISLILKCRRQIH